MANADWKCLLPYDAVAFIHVKSCDLYSRLLRPLMSQECWWWRILCVFICLQGYIKDKCHVGRFVIGICGFN